MTTVGGIRGKIKLVVGDGEIDLGTVYLPLSVTRVSPEKSPWMHMGIGVDLDEVRDAVEEIFKQAETDE